MRIGDARSLRKPFVLELVEAVRRFVEYIAERVLVGCARAGSTR
jgi:hypothetical protein